MAIRGYTLIDAPVYNRLRPDLDLIVAVLEHLRRNLPSLEPRIPSECELDLIAGETSHSHKMGPLPLLGLYAPQHVPEERIPDWQHLCAVVESWCAGKTDDELRVIGQATVAPTWEGLLASRIYPAREGRL
jgi:hypothetical protein